jgi:hypothetical protein
MTFEAGAFPVGFVSPKRPRLGAEVGTRRVALISLRFP